MSLSQEYLQECFIQQYASHTGKEFYFFKAPGRLNIIGEHTDYNGGLALPIAIDVGIYAAVVYNNEDCIRISSQGLDGQGVFKLNQELDLSVQPDWVTIALGMFHEIKKSQKCNIAGFTVHIVADLPKEAGLSSSAALALLCGEIARTMWNIEEDYSLFQLVLLAQYVEHTYVNVKCGLLDQTAIAFGLNNHMVQFNATEIMQQQEHEINTEYSPTRIPLHMNDYTFVVIDSGIRRKLGAAPYNKRRQECTIALEAIQTINPDCESLSSLNSDLLTEYSGFLDQTLYKRVRHVISENKRVQQMSEAFTEGNVFECGGLISDSHHSLRHDFEVSIPELDFIVGEAWKISGVLGARMVGAGFGGSVLVLCHKDAASLCIDKIKYEYGRVYDRLPRSFLTKASDGLGSVF